MDLVFVSIQLKKTLALMDSITALISQLGSSLNGYKEQLKELDKTFDWASLIKFCSKCKSDKIEVSKNENRIITKCHSCNFVNYQPISI